MMSTSEVALYRVADMQGQNWPELAIPWRYLSDTHPKHCQRPQIDPFVFSFPLLFFTQICSSIFISTNHVYPCMAIGPPQERYYLFFSEGNGTPGLSRSSYDDDLLLLEWWGSGPRKDTMIPLDQCAGTQVTWKWRPGWWLSGSLQGDVGREVPQMARVMSEAAT
jgi:hypothetical protein